MAVWCGDHVTLPSATGPVPLFADHGINLTQIRYTVRMEGGPYIWTVVVCSLFTALLRSAFNFRMSSLVQGIQPLKRQHSHQHIQPNIHIDLSLDCLWHTSYHGGTLLGPWIFTCWSSVGLVFFPACGLSCGLCLFAPMSSTPGPSPRAVSARNSDHTGTCMHTMQTGWEAWGHNWLPSVFPDQESLRISYGW